MTDLSAIIVEPEADSNRLQSSVWSYMAEHLTTVAHVGIFGVSIYLIYLCFLGEFTFFTWHPLLYTIGWFLFMTEGVLMISNDNVFSSRITHLLKVRFHWLLQTAASGCSVAAFTIVVINKGDRAHFQSWHGLLGLISFIFLVPTCLNGLLALYNVRLRMYISPTLNKFFHAVSGIFTVTLGGISMVLSLYTNWFSKMTEKNQDIFVVCFVFMTFGILWSLLRPMITFVRRLKTF